MITAPILKILMIVDELDVINQILRSLVTYYSIAIAHSRADAIKQLESDSFDLLILDLNLQEPGRDQIYAELQARGSWEGKPAVFLSSGEASQGLLRSLGIGDDDFLEKPFEDRELLARVQEKFRQFSTFSHERRIRDLWLSFERQEVYHCQGYSKIKLDLTLTEFRILAYLVQNEGQVVTRDQILEFACGTAREPSPRENADRSVDVHIVSLRRKMKGMHCIIKTVYRTGYTFSTT